MADQHEAVHAFHHHLNHGGARHPGHGGAGIIWLLILLHVAFIGYWGERPPRRRCPRAQHSPRVQPPTACA